MNRASTARAESPVPTPAVPAPSADSLSADVLSAAEPGSTAELRERVHSAIATGLGRPASSIDDALNFLYDLEVDSIAVLEILCALEDELGLEIDELEVFPVDTVGQLVDVLAKDLVANSPK